MHRFKNQEGKKIICYVNDERNGITAARALVDRGYENTFLLTGGIEKFIEDYPSLIEGNNIPKLVDKQPNGRQARRWKVKNSNWLLELYSKGVCP